VELAHVLEFLQHIAEVVVHLLLAGFIDAPVLALPRAQHVEVFLRQERVVNAELNCHFFTDADVPRLTNSLFLAPDTLLVVPGSYAVLSPDDLAESRAGAAVVSGACWLKSPARRFSFSRK